MSLRINDSIKYILAISFHFMIQSAFGQNFEVLNESEYVSLRNDFTSPDNLLKKYEYRTYSLVRVQEKFNHKQHSILLDWGLGAIQDSPDQLQTIRHDYRYEPIELYYKVYVKNWTFSAGRKKVRFGVGYVGSPTDIISAPTQFDDANDRLYRILGNDLVQASYTGSTIQYDFFYLPNTNQNVKGFFTDHSLGYRVYKAFNAIDLSLIGRYDFSNNLQLGLNSTYSIGQSLELHFEGLFQNKNKVLYPSNNLFYTKDEPALRILFGGQWSPTKNWNLALEYFYISEGYSTNEWNQLYDKVDYAKQMYAQSNPEYKAQGESLLNALGESISFPVTEHYTFLRVARNKIFKKLELEYLAFISLSELAALHRVAIDYDPNKKIKIYAHFQTITTNKEHSFVALNYYSKVRLGVKYNFTKKRKKRNDK